MTTDTQSETKQVARRVDRLVNLLREKNVLSDEEAVFVFEGTWPDDG